MSTIAAIMTAIYYMIVAAATIACAMESWRVAQEHPTRGLAAAAATSGCSIILILIPVIIWSIAGCLAY